VVLSVNVTATDTHRAIDAVWRIESARIIAGLAHIVRDVGLAEELAQDALVAALDQWPKSGIPDNPGAWLMATAKHRAIDIFRRNKLLERKHEELGRELQAQQEMALPNFDAALNDDIGDDLLRLVFISCHPVLSTEARVALTLRLLVSMAAPLPILVSDPHGCLTLSKTRAHFGIRSTSKNIWNAIIQYLRSWLQGVSRIRSFHCHRMRSESESQFTCATPAKSALP
jgi:DNA-directed RNA polymerase specialized sigma24 family protein